jgi:hypothetical protein
LHFLNLASRAFITMQNLAPRLGHKELGVKAARDGAAGIACGGRDGG